MSDMITLTEGMPATTKAAVCGDSRTVPKRRPSLPSIVGFVLRTDASVPYRTVRFVRYVSVPISTLFLPFLTTFTERVL